MPAIFDKVKFWRVLIPVVAILLIKWKPFCRKNRKDRKDGKSRFLAIFASLAILWKPGFILFHAKSNAMQWFPKEVAAFE